MSTHAKILILFCTVVSLALGQQVAVKTGDQHAYILPKKLAVEWILAGETRVWLSVNGYNGDEDWKKDGYNPSFVYLRCHYKPVVKKLKDGDWIVTFTSEIAEEPPGIP